jgi:excisionase family DNA binding protein
MHHDACFPDDWRHRPLLTAKDIAHALGIHPDDVYRLALAGEIPGSTKLGGRRRFRTHEVIRWIAGDNLPTAA